jgi:hypothetical protein
MISDSLAAAVTVVQTTAAYDRVPPRAPVLRADLGGGGTQVDSDLLTRDSSSVPDTVRVTAEVLSGHASLSDVDGIAHGEQP